MKKKKNIRIRIKINLNIVHPGIKFPVLNIKI